MKTSNLSRILMVIGIFIPCVIYPFASPPGYFRDGLFGAKAKITEYEVVIEKGEFIPGKGSGITAVLNGHYEGRIVIPYRYVFVLGILVFFIGLSIIVLKRHVT